MNSWALDVVSTAREILLVQDVSVAVTTSSEKPHQMTVSLVTAMLLALCPFSVIPQDGAFVSQVSQV